MQQPELYLQPGTRTGREQVLGHIEGPAKGPMPLLWTDNREGGS